MATRQRRCGWTGIGSATAGRGGSATLARDTNGDGDFADLGELTALPGDGPEGCDVDFRPGSFLTAALGNTDTIDLLIDRTGDGDFDDANETATISDTLTVDQLELRVDPATNSAFMGTASEVHRFSF